MPKISVIMSVYKEPVEWLKQSMDSILNQTFTDFEFIIINDNPSRPENTEILNKYASEDPRIIILANEQNIGLTKSLNKGLKIANGEYIARMDADDISLPERFEKQVKFMIEHKCDLCYTNYIKINGDGICIGNNIEENSVIEDLYLKDVIAHPTVLFKKSLMVLRQPLYDEDVAKAQDYELWTFLYMHGCTLSQMKDILLKYRVSQFQISTANKGEQVASFVKSRYKLISTYLRKYNINIESEDFGSIINKLEKLKKDGTAKDRLIMDHILFLLYMNYSKTHFSCLIRFSVNKLFSNSNGVICMWSNYVGYYNFPQLQIN